MTSRSVVLEKRIAFERAAALPLAVSLVPIYAVWVLARGRGAWLRHDGRIRIAAPARRVHALLDPYFPDNRWRLRGWTCDAVDAREGWFRLVDPHDPDAPMSVRVEQSAPGIVIAYSLRQESGRPLGAFIGSASRYDLERGDDGGSIVTLTENMNFQPGLSIWTYALHELLMRFSIRIDLCA